MIQRPKIEGNWLYQDRAENDRYFTTIVALGVNDEPWPECTDEARIAWQEEHPEPEPQTETEESVEQPTE